MCKFCVCAFVRNVYCEGVKETRNARANNLQALALKLRIISDGETVLN